MYSYIALYARCARKRVKDVREIRRLGTRIAVTYPVHITQRDSHPVICKVHIDKPFGIQLLAFYII